MVCIRVIALSADPAFRATLGSPVVGKIYTMGTGTHGEPATFHNCSSTKNGLPGYGVYCPSSVQLILTSSLLTSMQTLLQ